MFFKAVEQIVSKNQVSPMDWKSRKKPSICITDHFEQKRGQYHAKHRAKEVPKALDSNLIEIGVSVMDVNCTESCHYRHYS